MGTIFEHDVVTTDRPLHELVGLGFFLKDGTSGKLVHVDAENKRVQIRWGAWKKNTHWYPLVVHGEPEPQAEAATVDAERYPHKCPFGHAAWAPLGPVVECPTCNGSQKSEAQEIPETDFSGLNKSENEFSGLEYWVSKDRGPGFNQPVGPTIRQLVIDDWIRTTEVPAYHIMDDCTLSAGCIHIAERTSTYRDFLSPPASFPLEPAFNVREIMITEYDIGGLWVRAAYDPKTNTVYSSIDDLSSADLVVIARTALRGANATQGNMQLG